MTINKCNEKCKICSNESEFLNLCIECNNNSSFFPMLNYNNSYKDSFIDCGKEIQEEYYLDLEDNIYKPCYSSCKKCSKYGNESKHNCDECKINYISLNDSINNNNCYEICSFYYYFDSNNKYRCTNYNYCPDGFDKLIIEKNKCVSNCTQDNYYQYEFNNSCYKSCPNGTINNNNLCEIKIQNDLISDTCHENNLSNLIDYTYIIIKAFSEYTVETESNDKECIGPAFFDDNCKINNTTKSTDEIISNIKNEILNGDLLLSIINGNRTNLLKKDENVIYSLSKLDSQEDYKFNITSVDIGECEDILRDKYKLNQTDFLFIFKIEYFIEGYLFPIIEYEIYSNKIKEELNMDFCNDIKINMNIPININENDLFKHDPSNAYYNDICYSHTTEENTDIIIADRKKEFNDKNMSLCESSCIYKGYNKKTNKVSCECQTKNTMSLVSKIINNKDNLMKKFKDIKSVANINIIKCYYSVFKKDGLKSNIGSYLLLSITFVELILMIIFLAKGYYKFNNDIKEIITGNDQNSNVNERKNKEKTKNKKRKKGKKRKHGKKKMKRKNVENNAIKTQGNPPKNQNIKKNVIKINNNERTNIKIKNIQITNNINSKNKDNNNDNSLSAMNINKFNLDNNEVTIKNNDFELNNFSYVEALKLDKRL